MIADTEGYEAELSPEEVKPGPVLPDPWLPLPDEIKAEVQAFNARFGQMLHWWRVGAKLPDVEVNPATLTYRVK